ncbi:MAG: RNA pyrophosphohydrolase [Rhodobacteraceae bacterium]|nr:MAG: RNA pyrophosphohydrolase [Paracoccaceae bacterium]|tara:strand:- start:212 stop:688 length:477 start_codon:yes stop_codon:yes gene_type:complete
MQELVSIDYRPCVGLMIINDQRLIFTGQRLGYSSTAWQMPQGGIEKDEDPLVAAYRELQEETSILKEKVELLAVSKDWLTYDLPSDLIPKLWNGVYRGQTQKWFLMRFIGEDSDIDLQTKMPEFSSWRWSTKQQLTANIVDFKKELYEILVNEFNIFL